MVIFNRCDENSRKSPWRRAVKGLNSGTRIFFENLDGTTDDGVADEDLPYDVKADPVVIGDEDFGTFYLDALEHPDRYDGKRIHARGRAFRMEDMPKNCYVFGRHVMTCCADDIEYCGLACELPYEMDLETRDWISVTAKVEFKKHRIYKGKGPVLVAEKVIVSTPPEEQLATFY